MKIKKVNIILEKSIGSENIRNKHYQDIPKFVFYKLVNIDPTSVRKKDFSKPGKYTKWLIREFKKVRRMENYDQGKLSRYYFDLKDYVTDNDKENNDHTIQNTIKNYLFIFSTAWFKKNGGSSNDIFKYTLDSFIKLIYGLESKYLSDSEGAKFDLIYQDNKVKILVPLNFTASYETSKNTDWCTRYVSGFSTFSKFSIMFRIIPIIEEYDKLKLTWLKRSFTLSGPRYPEIYWTDSDFSKYSDEISWDLSDFSKEVNPFKKYKIKGEYIELWRIASAIKRLPEKNLTIINKTMSLLSEDVINYMINYYKDHIDTKS